MVKYLSAYLLVAVSLLTVPSHIIAAIFKLTLHNEVSGESFKVVYWAPGERQSLPDLIHSYVYQLPDSSFRLELTDLEGNRCVIQRQDNITQCTSQLYSYRCEINATGNDVKILASNFPY